MSAETFDTICFIFARGGSKGVQKKNIKRLGGKPLIAYSIECALRNKNISRVLVSTDCEEIAQIACDFGAEVPFIRPRALSLDNSPEWLAWRHAICWYADNCGVMDNFLSLPPTAPFRSDKDVDACIELRRTNRQLDVALTVCDSVRSPYFNIVKIDAAGYARVFADSQGVIARRQDVPSTYDITTVAYCCRPEFVLENDHMFAGRVKAAHVPLERSLDIDTPFDFMVAEALLDKLRGRD